MKYLIFLLSIYITWNVSALSTYFGADRIRNQQGFFSDNVREDDHEDFDLTEIIDYSTVGNVADPPTEEDRQQNVDLHNALRGNFTYPFPEIGDMPMLEYNNTLEWSAGEFLKECKFSHFFVPIENMTDVSGQSIYRGSHRHLSAGIYLFYHREYINYYFNNYTCREPYPKYMCGHMIQIMMSDSLHIGYNRRFCYPRHNGYLGAWYFLPGQVGWPPIFFQMKYRPTCSNCEPGYYCSQGLCIPDHERFCKAYNLDCECKRTCHNCGTIDLKNCQCLCKLGWDWGDCSFPCQNNEEKYTKRKCGRTQTHLAKRCGARSPDWRIHNCRKSCGTCHGTQPDSEPDELCCGGTICEENYVLDTDTCECYVKCPSLKCIPTTTAITTTTTTTTTPTTTTTTTTIPTTTTTTIPTTTTTTIPTTTTTTTAIPTTTTTTIPTTTTTTTAIPTTTTTTIPTTTVRPKIPVTITSTIISKTATEETSQKPPRPVSTTSIVIPSLKILVMSSFTFILISYVFKKF